MKINKMKEITKSDIEAVYQLSPMQEGILFHSILNPDATFYFEQFSCRINGKLNVEAFKNAWQKVLTRNQILRTSFVWKNSEKPLQIVHKNIQVPFDKINLKNEDPENQLKMIEEILREDKSENFNLNKTPLFKVKIVELSDEEYYFIWSFHHILIDGWSRQILLNELLTYYEFERKNLSRHLPENYPFSDYIKWIGEQDEFKSEQFWKKYLGEFESPLKLPLANLIDIDDTKDSQSKVIHLSKNLTEVLKNFCRRNETTLSTLLQASWVVLLNKFTNEDDILFGLTFSGRAEAVAGIESMIGLFINSLPVRVKLGQNENIVSLLQKIKNINIDINEYIYTPLVKVQDWSEVPNDLPLFQSLVVFENFPSDSGMETTDLKISDVKSFSKTNYPLLLVSAPAEEMPLELIYNPSYFSENNIDKIHHYLEIILEEFVYKSDKPLREIELLNEDEYNKILEVWSKGITAEVPPFCIHHLFEKQVVLTPNKKAVAMGDEFLTFEQLNKKANKIANYLLKNNFQPEDAIGIYLDRSIEMIVALFGILKAGCAYLPLDVSYPKERIEYVLNNSKAKAIISKSTLNNNLKDLGQKKLLLDLQIDQLENESENNPSVKIHPRNLAYIIYTSGSTGEPKGVMISHFSVVNLAEFIFNKIYKAILKPDYNIALNAPLIFDVSVQQIVMLLYGISLYIIPEELKLDMPLLKAYLQKYKINGIDCVPSQLKVMVESGFGEAEYPSLYFPAGEALDSSIWKELLTHQNKKYYNLYGPTEATVYTVGCKLLNEMEVPVIGRPLANINSYILDKNLKPVPENVPGELFLGGYCVARGYANKTGTYSGKISSRSIFKKRRGGYV